MEVCAVLINGTLEREVTVSLQTEDRTATSGGIIYVQLKLLTL